MKIKDKKKIVMITRYYYPHVGGVERHVGYISDILTRRGYSVKIITSLYDNKLKREDIVRSVVVTRFSYPQFKYIGLIWIWLWMIKNRECFKDADVVHCHDVFIWYLPIRFFYWCKPVFTTFHGYEGYPIKYISCVIRKISEKLSSGNICVGDFIRKWYKTNPNIVVYGGISNEALVIKENKGFFYDAVFSGRLDEQTGILDYIKAVRLLNKIRPFKFVVLGNGVYINEARKVGLVRGFVKNPLPYYANAVFAFVSRYLAILEAFALKKLVFAVYDNPLKEDYLKLAPFAKWIVIENDPENLAWKVQYYLDHPLAGKKMVDAAYEWVKGQTWEKVTDKYLQLWEI